MAATFVDASWLPPMPASSWHEEMSVRWLESVVTPCRLTLSKPVHDNGVDVMVRSDDPGFAGWRIPVQLKSVVEPARGRHLACGDMSYPLDEHVFQKLLAGTTDTPSVSGLLVVVMLPPEPLSWVRSCERKGMTLATRSWWCDIGKYRTDAPPRLRRDNKRTVRIPADQPFGLDVIVRKAGAIFNGLGAI